jgi:adenylate cyclase
MFTDIEHFSTTAEAMDPEQLMTRLSKYLESLGGAMVRHGGTIDKYIGDSIMAIWNAPEPDADHVAKACRAALAAATTSEWLEKKWEQRGREAFRTRCGLHTGIAVVGNVGSLDRLSYTVVGTVPNQASRLEGLNKVYGTKILASGHVFEATRDRFVWRHVDRVVPVGASQAVDLYEPMAEADAAGSPTHGQRSAFLSQWNDAMAAYRCGDMAEASRAFHALAGKHPTDGPCQTFAQRCDEFFERGLPRGWNGVTVFRHK